MFHAELLSANSFSEPANNSAWFDGAFYRDRYFVGVRGTAGLVIVDYADRENPVVADTMQIDFAPATYGRSMGLCLIDDKAYVAFRRGSGSDDGFGIIEEFDISDPYNIVRGDKWDPHSGTLVAYNPGVTLTYLYSDLCHDGGGNLLVAGQKSGFYKFSASNLSAGPTESIEVTEQAAIETQGVAYDDRRDLAVFANYYNGLTILDNATWGGEINHTVGQLDVGGDNLRPWQVTVKNGWAFVCVNVNYSSHGNSENRGLLTLDLRGDIASLTTADWNHSPIPVAYNDSGWTPSDPGGDQPQTDISVLGDYCYVANGQGAVLCWDVSDPASPVFVGSSGYMIEGDNLYLAKAYKFGSQDVLVYGDGFNGSNGSKSLYLAEVSHMSFSIGNYLPGVTTGSTSFVAFDNNRGPSSSGNYTAGARDTVDSYWFRLGTAPGGNRTLKVGLYNVTQDTLVYTETISLTTSDSGEQTAALTTPQSLTEGEEYTIRAVTSSLNIQLEDYFPTSAAAGATMTSDVNGELNSDLSGDGAWASEDPMIAFVGTANSGILTTSNCAGLVVGKS